MRSYSLINTFIYIHSLTLIQFFLFILIHSYEFIHTHTFTLSLIYIHLFIHILSLISTHCWPFIHIFLLILIHSFISFIYTHPFTLFYLLLQPFRFTYSSSFIHINSLTGSFYYVLLLEAVINHVSWFICAQYIVIQLNGHYINLKISEFNLGRSLTNDAWVPNPAFWQLSIQKLSIVWLCQDQLAILDVLARFSTEARTKREIR